MTETEKKQIAIEVLEKMAKPHQDLADTLTGIAAAQEELVANMLYAVIAELRRP
jgi:hypothetical protein